MTFEIQVQRQCLAALVVAVVVVVGLSPSANLYIYVCRWVPYPCLRVAAKYLRSFRSVRDRSVKIVTFVTFDL
jgi:hypothetical protein